MSPNAATMPVTAASVNARWVSQSRTMLIGCLRIRGRSFQLTVLNTWRGQHGWFVGVLERTTVLQIVLALFERAFVHRSRWRWFYLS